MDATTNGQLKTTEHDAACGMDRVAVSRARFARHQADVAEAERLEDPERFDEMAGAIGVARDLGQDAQATPGRGEAQAGRLCHQDLPDRELLDDPAFAGKCRAVVEARERLLDAVAELRAGVVRRAVWENTLAGLGVDARRVCKCGGCCDSRDVEIVVRLRAPSGVIAGMARDGGVA